MESDIILQLQKQFASPTARSFIIFVARWLIYFYPAFILLARLNRAMKLAVYEAMWTALLAFTMSAFIASLVDRIRPYLAVKGVIALVPPNIQAGSFPSSHTAVAAGIAIAIASAHPWGGVIAILMALLIAFGRVAAGMHFPTDIIGGAVVGVIAFLIVRAVSNGLGKI